MGMFDWLSASPGYDSSQGISNASILAGMLQDIGASYNHRDPTALAALQSQMGQDQQYKQAIRGMFGSPLNDVQITPQVSAANPGASVANGTPASASRQAAYNANAQNFQPGMFGSSAPQGMQQMLAAMPPELGMKILPQLAMTQMNRQQDIADKKITPISDQEAAGLGLRPGGVYGRDISGNITTIQPSDMKSAGAVQQAEQVAQDNAKFTNQLPMTAAQAATNKLDYAKLAEQQKEFGTIGGSPDSQQGIEYWAQQVAAGGQMPTLGMGKQAAAMRQQILNRAAAINGAQGLTGADQVAITAGAKSGSTALSKITPLRAATEAYEGTMLQNMDLAKGMIAKGAGTTGVPVLNRWQNYARGQYAGDPDVAAFNTAIQTVKNEYAKIQSGSIGNAPVSDSARKEAESMLDPSQTPAQLLANFDYMVKETGNRTKALRAQEQAIKAGLSGKNDVPATDAAASAPSASGWSNFRAHQ